jgi:hypothetical protein
MLTLFVLPSYSDKANYNATIQSFDGIVDFTYKVKNNDEINQLRCGTHKWFCVLFDDEYIDENLRAALSVFVKHYQGDILVFYKIDGKGIMSRCPRLFKNYVEIQKDCLLPTSEGYQFENVLNGWVKSHV